jgi:hypothetical protein
MSVEVEIKAKAKFQQLSNVYGRPVSVGAQWGRMLITVNVERGGSVRAGKGGINWREREERGSYPDFSHYALTTRRQRRKTVIS